ncbi:type II CAAX endopeptidase family protein [soil metagenome]
MNNPLIRKGWLRALIFLVIWVFLQMGVTKILFKLLSPFTQKGDQTDPAMSLLLVGFLSFLTSVPAVVIFRKLVDRKTVLSLGFDWNGNSKHAWTGFFCAIFILSAGTLLIVLTGNLSFIAFDFYWQDLMLYVLVMLFVAIAEELVIRGYILNNLLESFPKWIALLISASLFGLLHLLNPDFNWLSMIVIFIGGLALGINYIYTKNLWFGIFFHFAWNFFQGPIFGYKVSGLETDSLLAQNINGPVWLTGGPFGFEASALASLLILLVFVYLAFYYKRNEHAFLR